MNGKNHIVFVNLYKVTASNLQFIKDYHYSFLFSTFTILILAQLTVIFVTVTEFSMILNIFSMVDSRFIR